MPVPEVLAVCKLHVRVQQDVVFFEGRIISRYCIVLLERIQVEFEVEASEDSPVLHKLLIRSSEAFEDRIFQPLDWLKHIFHADRSPD